MRVRHVWNSGVSDTRCWVSPPKPLPSQLLDCELAERSRGVGTDSTAPLLLRRRVVQPSFHW